MLMITEGKEHSGALQERTTRLPVGAEEVGTNGLVRSCAPTQVFELPVSIRRVTGVLVHC